MTTDSSSHAKLHSSLTHFAKGLFDFVQHAYPNGLPHTERTRFHFEKNRIDPYSESVIDSDSIFRSQYDNFHFSIFYNEAISDLKSDPIISPQLGKMYGTQVGSMRIDEKIILDRMFFTLLDIEEFSEKIWMDVFESTYGKLLNFFDKDKIEFLYFVPLENFKSDHDHIDLNNEVCITSFPEDMKENILRKTDGINFSGVDDYVVWSPTQ